MEVRWPGPWTLVDTLVDAAVVSLSAAPPLCLALDPGLGRRETRIERTSSATPSCLGDLSDGGPCVVAGSAHVPECEGHPTGARQSVVVRRR